MLQLDDDEFVNKLVLLQHCSEITAKQFFGRILFMHTNKGRYELSGEHKGKKLVHTYITARVLTENVREDIAPPDKARAASESVVDDHPHQKQRPRLSMQEQASDSSRGDLQPSDILDMNEIKEMRRIQGRRCDDCMKLCENWSKQIAKWFPSSQQGMIAMRHVFTWASPCRLKGFL